MISYKFPFLLCLDKAKYHWLKSDIRSINFDWWHSWLTHHKCLSYDAFRSLEYYDYSFVSVIGQWFMSTVWLYFLPFSLYLNPAVYISQQIIRLKRGCQENIGILNFSVFVVLKSFPTTKAVNFISKWMCAGKISSRNTKTIAVMNKHFFATVESNKCNFWWIWSLNRCNSFATEATCFPLNSRNIVDPTLFIGYNPDQKIQTNCLLLVVLVSVQSCNILLLEP